MSDGELIRDCRKGKSKAWERLLKKYERLVFSIPLNYGLSRDDAADISQLTFTILIQNLHTLSEDSRLGAWLATVARRHTWRLLERHRRETASEHVDLLAENAVLIGKGDTESIEHWELTEWLHQGLSLISESCQNLLTALYFDPKQPSYAEVAEHLNMPLGSVGPTRARCLKDLKKAMLGR